MSGNMNYEMEDTQNSAPGQLPSAQATKLGAPKKGPDGQSTTKRYVNTSNLAWRNPGRRVAHDQSRENAGIPQ